jgi:hypothetical protein
VVASHRVKHARFAKRMRAPEFATRGHVLTSAESRMTTAQPESAMARRFRGFIDPMPMAQNDFEAMRKPHIVPLNLEPPVGLAQDAAPVVAEGPVPATAPALAAKQDRVAPQAVAAQPAMELASAESRPVTLGDPAPAKPAAVAAANTAPAPQAFFSAAATQPPDQPQRSGFPVHQLVIALCGALGAASALRFIVGA